jgi:hypothetical protein
MRVFCLKFSGRFPMRRRESRALLKRSCTCFDCSAAVESVRLAPRQRVTVPIGSFSSSKNSGVVSPEVSNASHFLVFNSWPVSEQNSRVREPAACTAERLPRRVASSA